jgi:hypothetical protein
MNIESTSTWWRWWSMFDCVISYGIISYRIGGRMYSNHNSMYHFVFVCFHMDMISHHD